MQTNILGYRVIAGLVLVPLLQSCGGPKSSSTSGPDGGAVPTSRIHMYLTVESSDPGVAVVRANLNDGKLLGVSYRLDGGDFLRACVNGTCRSMADNDSVFTPDYIARFDYQTGVDYVVSFNRQEARDALDSRVALPLPFSIVTPVSRQPVTDGDTVLVSWAPTGAPARVELEYEATCTFASGTQGYSTGTLSTDADGNGRESVSIDPIVSFARSNVASPVSRCSIDVVVRHELDGRVDPEFDDGFAIGVVLRKVRLDYTPRS
jgi:hypothetical protein